MEYSTKAPPGRVRDAIVDVLGTSSAPLSVQEIERRVSQLIGHISQSSVRSYLRLNTPRLFVREERGVYGISASHGPLQPALPLQHEREESFSVGRTTLYRADCFDWLARQADQSIHAVVTDPPYGLQEYSEKEQEKLRRGRGGVWRIPPSFDGHVRSPLPRFTTLTESHLSELRTFFYQWGEVLLPKLVPGANVIVASNQLVSHIVSIALAEAGLERRGEIVRLVMTMRGGDRPKAAHYEFANVSVMPRSMWEPWLVYRKPIVGRVQDNLRTWKTGGFRRPQKDKPFCDMIRSAPTRANERALAAHPSLKPQAFLRQVVRGVLPLGQGVVCDPFAGAGSTLAAAEAVGYESIGVEKDHRYYKLACRAIPRLIQFQPRAELHTR
jgi:DNA modification methylase